MKKIKNFLMKHSGSLAALVAVVGVLSLDSACFLMFHQPKVPKSLDDYRM